MAVTASIRDSSSNAVRAALTSGKRDVRGMLFALTLLLCLLGALLVLTVLMWDVIAQAIPVFQKRSTGFLTNDLNSSPDKAGVSQGIWGSLMIAMFVVLLAFPVGIAAGVYLEEYAKPSRFNAFIRLNIRNLAGVPSVVYGILGLVVFVQGLDWLTGGRSVISAGITLAILVLPIIIITTAESVSAVPSGLREAGYGVGGTLGDHPRSRAAVCRARHPHRHHAGRRPSTGRSSAAVADRCHHRSPGLGARAEPGGEDARQVHHHADRGVRLGERSEQAW